MPSRPAARALRRKRNNDFISAAKNVPCADCGQRFPPVAMDFDHVRGVKSKKLSRFVADDASLDAIRAELEKCEVRCACCHRIRHAGES